ncbi:hypothetical protein KR009_007529 [Drosophila setifemur]|nr:hypothetical protein KR009_007529 [Drosophila setifemur]
MKLCTNFKLLRKMRMHIRNLRGLASLMRIPSARTVTGQQIYTLESLGNRELIRVHGSDVIPFLQALVTNDMSQMQSSSGPSSMYGLLLNQSGRVLYDTIIYRTNNPDTFLLECDREASPEFRRHLRTYRMRKHIDIDSVDDEYGTWVLFSTKADSLASSPNPDLFVSRDPRLPALGTRVLAPTDMTWTQLVKGFCRNKEFSASPASPDSNYQLLRYKQGVGEGSLELPPGRCFPLEANADYLNGVSFHKGCYVGQELTARIHHSGVIRKRYMPIRLTAPIGANQEVKSVAGARLGRVFGAAHDHGVALLRIEQVLNGRQELVVDDERCFADRPEWWPEEQPGKRRMAFAE